jgi:hypothetical protein
MNSEQDEEFQRMDIETVGKTQENNRIASLGLQRFGIFHYTAIIILILLSGIYYTISSSSNNESISANNQPMKVGIASVIEFYPQLKDVRSLIRQKSALSLKEGVRSPAQTKINHFIDQNIEVNKFFFVKNIYFILFF